MTIIAKVVLLLWLPIALSFFRFYPPRKAILLTLVGGILFLPQRVVFSLPIIPDYTSSTAIVYPVIIGLFIYDTKWLTRLEPWWLDIPVLVLCMTPLFASIRNDLGIYDGINTTLFDVWMYGIPYLLGRVYFNNLANIKKLAVAVVQGGLLYVPFCIWEGLMSPQIHKIIYGYYAHTSGIRQSIRAGGYRPMVFMSHGLAVGLWIMGAALIAVWLWQSKAVQYIWGVDMFYIVAILVFTLMWNRSTGAYFLFAYGVLILAFAKWRKSTLPLFLLIIAIIIYLYVAIQGNFDKMPVLNFLSNFASLDRVRSLEFRLDQETLLIDKAREQFWFGWGAWGRSRVREENYYGIFQDISVTDSLWILAFGSRGVIGIISLAFSFLIPALSFPYLSHSVKVWFHPQVGSAAVLAILLPLFMLDNIANNFVSPMGWVMTGAVTGLILNTEEGFSRFSIRSLKRERKRERKVISSPQVRDKIPQKYL
jgi:hypothetical protein